MPDILTKAQRSENMRRMKASDTLIEQLLRKALWAKGFRYRKNVKDLPGKPDIVLKRYKIAIFCDGEFFHGKDWESLRKKLKSSNNGEFWIKKISRNVEHDKEVNEKLEDMGYTVLRFWGNDIKKHLNDCISVIEETALSRLISKEIN